MKISKTTKRNIDYLQCILDDLLTAQQFILSDETVVARVAHGTCTNEYHCAHSATWNMPAFVRSIDKRIGSDLCYLYNARQKLELFLTQACS